MGPAASNPPLGFVEGPEQERDAKAIRWLCRSSGGQSHGGPCGPCSEVNVELEHLTEITPSSLLGSDTSLCFPP